MLPKQMRSLQQNLLLLLMRKQKNKEHKTTEQKTKELTKPNPRKKQNHKFNRKTPKSHLTDLKPQIMAVIEYVWARITQPLHTVDMN